ncbi:MAG: conjugal transfer protein TraG, partial [Desulfobulbaceae bacterium]|nr:conjugal transfer protein TraG [Desulfobulbaceae bacterium]
MARKRKKKQDQWTHVGTGIHLDRPETIVDLGFPDGFRKGHFWCFGTTRVGKTRLMEHIIEQDISKGYSVVAIDPKGDIDLFSKITQLAEATGRLHDLMLITP